ncbi:uncharacterized protein HMPREF1541_06092 [Cyphellophora europaea CBS 101466]|uniref:Transcription factor domain-containing protein n=1 Tax=Cyphellophora europaea (strain CBS 101466) TaxID=1220924 RepID=W2RTQ4_CYPE1|nr:uncharacterized protein HMPREF1541_06092 [Cyphellophora europaea CBS 101466]ETN39866.1 hypothetical protein HMPREF1541_06092 [Cyphellophora europaea CBS 101466]
MAKVSDFSDLVIISHNPGNSTRAASLERARALAYAARISSPARKKKKALSMTRLEQRQQAKEARNTSSQENVATLQLLGSRATLLTTLLKQGNSDPFNSMPVQITPSIGSTLSFWNSRMPVYCSEGRRVVNEKQFNTDIVNLHNEACCSAFLFLCATLMSAQNPQQADLVHNSLRLKNQALQTLRTEIARNKAEKSAFALRAIVYLFEATIMTAEVSEAKIHGAYVVEALRQIEAKKRPKDYDKLLMLVRMYYLDAQSALGYMRRMTLNPNDMVSLFQKSLEPIQQWVDTQDPSLFAGITDAVLFSRNITAMFRQMRVNIMLQHSTPEELELYYPALVCQYPVPHHLLLVGHALEHIDRLANWLAAHPAETSDTYTAIHSQYRTEIVLSLALLVYLSRSVHSTEVLGEWTLASGLLSKLMYWLADESQPDGLARLIPPKAQVWALYVGSCWELSHRTPVRVACKASFLALLKKRAAALQLSAWQEVNAVLAEFLNMDSMLPNGAEWFESLMRDDDAVFERAEFRSGAVCHQSWCGKMHRVLSLPDEDNVPDGG